MPNMTSLIPEKIMCHIVSQKGHVTSNYWTDALFKYNPDDHVLTLMWCLKVT